MNAPTGNRSTGAKLKSDGLFLSGMALAAIPQYGRRNSTRVAACALNPMSRRSRQPLAATLTFDHPVVNLIVALQRHFIGVAGLSVKG